MLKVTVCSDTIIELEEGALQRDLHKHLVESLEQIEKDYEILSLCKISRVHWIVLVRKHKEVV